MIIWLTGLSGAGKTTIGKLVYDQIKTKYSNTVFLDGDILREVWGDQLGHDIDGRYMNAKRISLLCALLDRQGIHTIACVLSIFPEWRKWNRETFSEYYEVFIDTPIEEVIKRDSKGLYKKALAGELTNVVGIDIPMPPEETWDMKISEPEVLRPPEELAVKICKAIQWP